MVGIDAPQVDPLGLGRRDHIVGAAGHSGQHGVEVLVVHQRIAERRRDRRGVAVHATGDRGQSCAPW